MAPLAIALLAPKTTAKHTTTHPSTTEVGSVCTLPFDSIKQHHPIDDSCDADGAAAPNTPQSAQNDAKNNFCSTGTPINIDFEVLRQLQQDAGKSGSGITFGGDSQIPKDRTVLRNLPTKVGALSEGDVVRIAAFVVDAHGSNLGKGESVNCKVGGKENNDIHIVLGEKSNAKGNECDSVTAEMSPHFRPDVWAPDILNQHNEHKYRFTGQLFFDASHKPCAANGTGSPKRASIWEVHPVYAVDICIDPGNNCKVDSDLNWVSLEEGVNGDSSETRLWLPEDEISREFGARARPSSTP
jgi:hypothetical protein